MQRVNIGSVETSFNPEDPDGFRSGGLKLGPLFGASELGASVYELPPGEALCPYHYEYAEEEALLVLAGTPSVRTPEGVEQLAPLDVVFFPTGPAGAHQVLNSSAESARVLMFSTVKHPAATVYPDSDKVAIWTGNKSDDVIVHRTSGVGYWSGESSTPPSEA